MEMKARDGRKGGGIATCTNMSSDPFNIPSASSTAVYESMRLPLGRALPFVDDDEGLQLQINVKKFKSFIQIIFSISEFSRQT